MNSRYGASDSATAIDDSTNIQRSPNHVHGVVIFAAKSGAKAAKCRRFRV